MSADRPQAQWEVYFTHVDGAPTAIMVDLALRATAPMSSHPHLFVTEVSLRTPRENGLPTREESDEVLYPMEDRIVAALQTAEAQAIHVGKVSGGGVIRCYFYCPPPGKPEGGAFFGKLLGGAKASPTLKQRLDQVMKAYPAYAYRCFERTEADWGAYLQLLYPSAWELQAIMNRRVVDNLRSHGDLTDRPREIDHFILCPDAAIQAGVAAGGEQLGFRCVANPVDERGVYGLNLHRQDVPDQIDGVVWPLVELAEQHGATYDGWGAVIVKA